MAAQEKKALLDPRFQLAIDQAAMVAGYQQQMIMSGSGEESLKNVELTLAAVVAEEVKKIEASYPPEREKSRTIRRRGIV